MIDEEKLLDEIMDCVDISIDTKTNIVNMANWPEKGCLSDFYSPFHQ